MFKGMAASKGAGIDASFIPPEFRTPVGRWIKRVFAFLLVALSLYGTYVQAADFSAGEPLMAIGLALAYQAVCSVAQFAFRRQWQSIWYIGALAASVVPSILTYGPLVTPGLGDLLAGAVGYDLAAGGAWAVVGIVMVLADIVPEQIIVGR